MISIAYSHLLKKLREYKIKQSRSPLLSRRYGDYRKCVSRDLGCFFMDFSFLSECLGLRPCGRMKKRPRFD